MATKNAKAPARSSKGADSTQRGRRVPGRRTTLRVPKTLDTEVARVSRELGISGNEALVRLAARGAESARREREVRRVIESRHAAVMEAAVAEASAAFPTEREMREAILVDRD